MWFNVYTFFKLIEKTRGSKINIINIFFLNFSSRFYIWANLKIHRELGYLSNKNYLQTKAITIQKIVKISIL